MNRSPVRSRLAVILIVCYLLIGSVVGRNLPYYLATDYQWIVMGLFGLYILFFAAETLLPSRFKFIIHILFVLQIAIVLLFLLAVPEYGSPQDYFAILLIPLCIQAVWLLPSPVSTAWVILLSVISGLSMIVYYQVNEDSWEGVGYGLAYVAVCILVSVFSSVTRRAEEARNESQALLAELQVANRKLQEYAAQAEQLAAVEERNRLARDLHDSVSQTIFSMTLTAQAARILIDRDPERVPAKLDHLQALAQHALAEMRYLIQHMGPSTLTGAGLRECLQRLVEERRVQDHLSVELQITGDRRLPVALEEGIYRVVQEGLNNIIKHAKTDQAWVTLRLEGNPITLCIEDRGVGFDPAQVHSAEGHLGLAGITDRVRIMGGITRIESQPGAGTRLHVEIAAAEEGQHA